MSTISDVKQNVTVRDPARWKILFSVIVAMLAVTLDGALMGLIAPAISQDLETSASAIGLISSISMLTLAAFIMGGGVIGDIYGRKRFLSYGLFGIIITSILAMMAPTAGLLIPVRALAGIMAALVNPLSLAIITVTFDKEERPKALSLYVAAIGVIGGLGTIIIGLLNQQMGWRSTFGLVILFSVIALVMVKIFVTESKASKKKKLDWTGILLMALGLIGIIYGINQAASHGFGSVMVLVPVAFGIILLVILVYYSGRAQEPVLHLSLFGNSLFSVGTILILLMGFCSMGSYFQLSTYLQTLENVSPVYAALTLLPFTLSLFVFSILAGLWVGKLSNRVMIIGGLVFMSVGLILIGFWINPTADIWTFMLPLILLGGGYSIANIPRMNAMLGTAPQELAGFASATNNASLQLGSSLGVAIMGVLFQGHAQSIYRKDLTALGLGTSEIEKSIDILVSWLETNSGNVASKYGITVQQLEGLIMHYENAFTSGETHVLWIGAAIALAGTVLAWFTYRKNN